MSQLTVRNLTLAYDGKPVVENLNFSVEKGDYLCVVGENGSGKSTLIRSILGLLTPVSGSIEFGENVRRGSIGYLPQQTQVQRDFPASAGEVVLSGCVASSLFFFSRNDRKNADRQMELLGISDLKNKCYRELSGGQQQRVLLARALCATKTMLLLDEPVTGLDPMAAAEMYASVKELNNKGLTVIMISHDIKAATENANRILHLSHGGSFFGTTADYLMSDIGEAFMKGGRK